MSGVTPADDPVAELRTVWDERGILETELAVDHKGTILAGARTRTAHISWPAVVRELPQVQTESGPLVELGDEIGRGAMGVVRSGTQRSLDREIAVKTPLARVGTAATSSLLREAWISGRLEHPNVIPVYALYREGDAPLLLMRRVEGSEWSLVLRERDALEADLRTLVQVCHAVHFAHTRGIVHLDLKPSNIMVGNYGEIYLLDWGIAACLRDDLAEFLPRTRELEGVLGTPAYMAPELAIGDGPNIDARTDVYLLGAILHEILTGRPPHVGDNLVATLSAAYAGEPPDWPTAVPNELATIATRAMARTPEDRYQSAAAFREALEDYLVHADSLSLAAAAQERSARIAGLLERAREKGADTPDGPTDIDTEIDGLAAEAEFGFRQALHIWPQNEAARDALQTLLEQIVERDLARGRWQIAQRRLAQLPAPRHDLAERAEALRVASTRANEELERLRNDVDLDLSGKQRSLMAFVGAFMWAAALIGLGQLDHWGVLQANHGHMLAITLGGTTIFAAMVHLGRKQLFANAISRNAVALLSVGWILANLYWIGAWRLGTPFDAAVVGVTSVVVFVIAGHAASVDRRLVPHTAVAIASNVLVFFVPEWSLEVLGAAGWVVLLMLSRTWSPRYRAR